MTLSNKFDDVFRRRGHGIPVAFLRALSQRESSMNPAEQSGPAWGLMQITESARAGTGYSRTQLLDPEVSVDIAGHLLQNIIRSYARHPSSNMHEDWSNPEFVKLLVMGWNAGYSEGGGVGKVATYLEQHSIPVTHDNVFHHAREAGGISFLSDVGRRQWHRSVADLYFAQPDAKRGSGGMLLAAGAAVVIGLVIARYL